MNSLILYLYVLLHPIHISITEMEYKAKDQTLEISTKVYTDDLERDLKKHHGRTISIDDCPEAEMNQLLESLFNTRIFFENTKSYPELNVIGYELEGEATWIYIKAEKLGFKESPKLKIHTLFQIYGDQKNILHFKSGELETHHIFEEGSPPGELKIK